MLLVFIYLIFFHEYSPPDSSIISIGLGFIRDNSVFVGGVVAVITSFFWMKKLLREKRAEAFFGFYASLIIQIKFLKEKLEKVDGLNISDVEYGNIFSLLYEDSLFKKYSAGYHKPEKNDLTILKDTAKKLKETLSDSQCNVFPVKADPQKWYDSQYTLYSFCDFLVHIDEQTKYGTLPKTNEPLHIYKCKKLLDAINYIEQLLSNIKY